MAIWEPLTTQVFGMITAKTVPVVLEFLGERLRSVLDGKLVKNKNEVETLKKEIEALQKQLEQKADLGPGEIQQVEAKIEKVDNLQKQYGLELISDQAHKQWVFKQFEQLSDLKNSRNNFKIYVWTQAGISNSPRDISIIPQGAQDSYQIGDKITFFFRSEQDCYLTLFNLGTSGSITILFPNKLFQDNLIKAGQTYTIPGAAYSFEYMLSGPAGVEKIKAVATTEKINLMELDFSQNNRIFYSTDRSAAAKDIQIVEKRLKEMTLIGWATTTCEFTVR